MTSEQIALPVQADTASTDVGIPEALVDMDENGTATDVPRGWENVRKKVLSVVGASLNFRTLRDMYNEAALDPKRLKYVSKIGEGNYGTVSRYDYLEQNGTTSVLAIKRLRGDSTAQAALDFIKEVKILRQLKNEHIVGFRGTGYLATSSAEDDDDEELFLALELMEGGSLRELLERQRVLTTRNNKEKLYTLLEGLQWLIGVACALAYLHVSEPVVIHRDIKPENIMFTSISLHSISGHEMAMSPVYLEDRQAKIVDFGLHRAIDRYEKEYAEDDGMYDMTGAPGAYMYMAPEAILNTRYNHKVDVYSFACIAWEIAHYQLLISATCTTGSQKEVQNYARHVSEEEYRPLIVPSLVPKDLGELIQVMWAQDPNKRPEFDEIVTRLKQICERVKQEEDAKRRAVDSLETKTGKKCRFLWCCFGYE